MKLFYCSPPFLPASLKPSLSCALASPPFFATLSFVSSSAEAKPLFSLLVSRLLYNITYKDYTKNEVIYHIWYMSTHAGKQKLTYLFKSFILLGQNSIDMIQLKRQ